MLQARGVSQHRIHIAGIQLNGEALLIRQDAQYIAHLSKEQPDPLEYAPEGIGLGDLTVLGRSTCSSSSSRPRGSVACWLFRIAHTY